MVKDSGLIYKVSISSNNDSMPWDSEEDEEVEEENEEFQDLGGLRNDHSKANQVGVKNKATING